MNFPSKQFDDKTEFFTSSPYQRRTRIPASKRVILAISCMAYGRYGKLKMRRIRWTGFIYCTSMQEFRSHRFAVVCSMPSSKDNENDEIIWKMFEFDVMFEDASTLRSYHSLQQHALWLRATSRRRPERMLARNHWTHNTHVGRRTNPSPHRTTIYERKLCESIYPRIFEVVAKVKQLSTTMCSTFSKNSPPSSWRDGGANTWRKRRALLGFNLLIPDDAQTQCLR